MLNLPKEEIERLAALYLKQREKQNKWAKTEKGRKLHSIKQMIYMARKKGDIKRVEELERRRQLIKEACTDGQKRQSRPVQSVEQSESERAE